MRADKTTLEQHDVFTRAKDIFTVAVTPRPRQKRKRRSAVMPFWPSAQLRRRWSRKFRDAPRGVRYLIVVLAAGIAMFLVNWSYQVARKPSELFFPVSDALYKTPPETWNVYGSLFRQHATAVVTPALLAALAQVEASGNP